MKPNSFIQITSQYIKKPINQIEISSSQINAKEIIKNSHKLSICSIKQFRQYSKNSSNFITFEKLYNSSKKDPQITANIIGLILIILGIYRMITLTYKQKAIEDSLPEEIEEDNRGLFDSEDELKKTFDKI